MVVTALRLAGSGDGELRFVDDQHGSPTFTADLAPAIVTLGLDRRPGIFHVTNSGATTWWGFVRAVLAEAGADPERVLPDQHGRARSAPPGAPPGQLGARQHGAAPERPARPACLGGRPGPPGPRPPGGAGTGMSHATNDRDGPAHGGRHRRRLRGPADRGDAGALRPPRRAGRARAVQAVGAALGPHADRRGRPRRAGGRAAWRRATSPSPTRPSTRSPGRSSSSCACRRRRAPTARPTCPTSRRRPRRSRRICEPGAIVVNKSTVPVGSANMVERVIGRAGHRRRLQPRVPPRGHRGRRQPQPRPHRRRGGRRAGGGQGGGAVLVDPGAAHRHRRHDLGDDQVRVERVPGHQAQLRQRPGRPVRGGRGRRPRRAARPGLRQAHRLRVPAARDPAGAVRACPRTPGPSSTSPARRATTSRCWPAPSPPTTSSSPGWWPRSRRACGGSADGATIAVWGLTFKANTDDRRDSPSLQIAHRLADLGATVQAFDPTVDAETDVPDLQDLELRADPYAAAAGAQVLVVLTEWDEFRWLDFSRVHAPWPSPTSSTPATCSTRPPCAVWASSTQGSGASEPGRGGRRRRLPGLAPLRPPRRAGRHRRLPRRPVDRIAGERGPPAGPRPLQPDRHQRQREGRAARRGARSTPCATWPPRRRRRRTSPGRSTRWPWAARAPGGCSSWPGRTRRGS